MDDGFQSARIQIDYALLVVDARRGIGNGHVIPGGPVRAPTRRPVALATALLKIGEGAAADDVVRLAARAGRPIFEAASRRAIRAGSPAGASWPSPASATRQILRHVAEAGGEVVVARPFADHHFYAEDELANWRRRRAARDSELVTTAKDAARLGTAPRSQEFSASSRCWRSTLVFEHADARRARRRIVDGDAGRLAAAKAEATPDLAARAGAAPDRASISRFSETVALR